MLFSKSTLLRSVLLAFALILCLGLLGCADAPAETTPQATTPAPTTPTATTPQATTPAETTAPDASHNYYTATVNPSDTILISPYTAGGSTPSELSGIYYSASTPGGTPTKDGTGSIWLVLTPTEKNKVSKLEIEGTYTSVEDLGNDIYCIHGVASDLTVTVKSKRLFSSTKDMFAAFGYGIKDDGTLVISWEDSEEVPLRYVAFSYKDADGTHMEYLDASLGRLEWPGLESDVPYTFYVQPIGYSQSGKTEELDVCYMNGPRSVSFPRVEITTEDYILPGCDFVQSPDEYWGAGITNALYEQCTVTIYDKDNQIVYDSTMGLEESEEFLGAKIKIRGNTSARYADSGRYPYKLKLNKKCDLLEPLIGRPDDDKGYADKDWLLLNYGSDVFRICGDAIADSVGTEWSPDYCYVALYVNGEYRGLYVLSESVKEGNGEGEDQWRVPVDTDGYVIECDAYFWNEDLYFSTPLTQNTAMQYTFKYPDADDIDESSPEYLYIKDYMTRFEEAYKKNDDSYLDYIDLDSFVKWLLVSDYLCITDGGGCNIFLYKEDSTENTKVYMGPNWDFDSYMGDYNSLAGIRVSWSAAPFYFHSIVKRESFMTRYKELFLETYEDLTAAVEAAFDAIDADAYYALLQYESELYGTKVETLEAKKDRFLNWLDQHLAWMETRFK